jgi:hypothetical protein
MYWNVPRIVPLCGDGPDAVAWSRCRGWQHRQFGAPGCCSSRSGQAEVEQPGIRRSRPGYATLAHEEDVAGLEIAVHDAGAVRGVERARDLRGDGEHLVDAHRQLARAARAHDARGERLALEELHDEERPALLLANVVERTDVRVFQLREHARLALEALAQSGIGDVRGQDLDGDGSIQARVPRLVDLTHAAGAGERLDFVGPDARAAGQGHFAVGRRQQAVGGRQSTAAARSTMRVIERRRSDCQRRSPAPTTGPRPGGALGGQGRTNHSSRRREPGCVSGGPSP